jgi:hypothetical protein
MDKHSDDLYRFLLSNCAFNEAQCRDYLKILREANFTTID